MITDPEKRPLTAVKFPFLSRSALMEFAKEHTPDMGMTELRYCQQFYLNEAKRDPTLSELSFLNTVVTHHALQPETVLISELSTNDGYIAETFSDLMTKRAMLEPGYTMPCSLAGIPTIARDYLAARRRDPVTDPVSFSCRKHHRLELAAAKNTASLPDGNADMGFSAGEKRLPALINREPLMPGDRIYVLLGNTDPTESLEEKLIAFASSPSVTTDVKLCLPVGSEGLLFPLIHIGHGFALDLTRLYGKETNPESLLDPDLGLILIARASASSDMLIAALDAGLRPRLAGQLLADGRITIENGKNGNYTFSVSFFRSLFLSRAYRAEVQSHNLTDSRVALSAFPFSVGARQFSAFRADGNGESPYHTALYTAISAVASCIAQGGVLGTIRIAETLRLPLDDISASSLGDRVALLLGLYRAVTELELTDVCTDLRTTHDTDSLITLYAIIPAPVYPTPDRVDADDSKIFLLEPAYGADGIPDFDDLKKMFAYVGKLRRDGLLLSARAVTGNVISALEEMDRENLVEYLRREPITAKPGSILVEARGNIQGMFIAKNCRSAPTASDTNPAAPTPDLSPADVKEEDNA